MPHQPAGDDAIPVGHIRIDVEGKAVAGDPAGVHLYPDGGDLGGRFRVVRPARIPRQACCGMGLHPHAGETFQPVADYTQAGQGGDDDRLDLAQVADVISLGDVGGAVCNHQPAGAQGDQWVTHQLTRAVIGHIPTPVDPVDGDAAPGKLGFVPQQVFELAAPPKSESVGMFQE
jgi:hypothetical protein